MIIWLRMEWVEAGRCSTSHSAKESSHPAHTQQRINRPDLANRADTMENTLAVSNKVKHALITQPSHLTVIYLPRRNEKESLCRDLYMNVN